MKQILFVAILVSLCGIGMGPLWDTPVSSLIVSAQQNPWTLILQITEPSGSGCTLTLGGSPNASDGKDDLDLPEPPTPPVLPYVRAWFTTPFSPPFDKLLQEYKSVISPRMIWNLSLIWVSESENGSLTTISITWDPMQAANSEFNSLKFYENKTLLANLLTDHSYSFLSNGTLRHFQIIGEGRATFGGDLQILLILFGISIGVIVIILIVFIYKRKRRGVE